MVAAGGCCESDAFCRGRRCNCLKTPCDRRAPGLQLTAIKPAPQAVPPIGWEFDFDTQATNNASDTFLPTHRGQLNAMHMVSRPVPASALLLIDVINDLEFPGGECLLEQAQPMAQRIATLKRRASRAGIPAIYVNEDADRWQPSFSRQVDRCLRHDVRGRSVVELLRPEQRDYFLLTSQHSVCFLTNLDVLLEKLRIRTLVLTGMVAGICERFAAHDAYLSGFRYVIPNDCVASKSEEGTASALRQLRQMLNAEIRPSSDLLFSPE